MSINGVLKKLDFEIEKDELSLLKRETSEIVELLKKELGSRRIKAEVFIGGSFAKGTLIKDKGQDIDLFVRFHKKTDGMSDILEKVVSKMIRKGKMKFERVHGSRDYFRLMSARNTRFEIIPVLKVKSPKESENVTDLSYFHVNYVKRKINSKIAREIGISKAFLKAQGAYGAESYINGISGYGVECLLIYYKTFEKMARAFVKSNEDEKIIIDLEKKYKNTKDLLLDVNESKSHGPIILIDPTWKERNVLAALSKETFIKLKENLKKFLANPHVRYFEIKEFDNNSFIEYAKKNRLEYLDITLATDRQEGDIAGTKLKKFSNYIMVEMGKYFKIVRNEFVYDDEKSAELHLIVKPNKEFVKVGPPLKMKSECLAFKSQNSHVMEKKGRLYSISKINFSCEKFVNDFKNKYSDKIKEMDVTGISVI